MNNFQKSKTGKEYELTVRAIYESILKLKGLQNVRVLHDQHVEGKTVDEQGKPLKHQIDVYWEFVFQGKQYCSIIQAKDLTKNVSLSAVLTFKAVRDDMTKPCRAVMVTRTGYQKSAAAYAKAHGIEIVLLDEPTEDEIANRIQHIRATLTALIPSFSNLSLECDLQWLGQNGHVLGENLTVAEGPTDQVMLIDDSGKQWSLHQQLHKMLPKLGEEAEEEFLVSEKFDRAVYILRNDSKIPRVKLLAVGATANIYRHEHLIAIDFPITMILRSITGDDRYFVDNLFNIRAIRE